MVPNDPHDDLETSEGPPAPDGNESVRPADLRAILASAARMAVEHGAPLELFMSSAYGAYLGASPELREHVEREQTRAEMEELRRRGLLALA